MPATFASFSRAPGFNEYFPVSNRTSDMLTMRPRAAIASLKNRIQLLGQLRTHRRLVSLRLLRGLLCLQRIRPRLVGISLRCRERGCGRSLAGCHVGLRLRGCSLCIRSVIACFGCVRLGLSVGGLSIHSVRFRLGFGSLSFCRVGLSLLLAPRCLVGLGQRFSPGRRLNSGVRLPDGHHPFS